VYDSGPRYTLGKVNFAGDTPFDEELLQRMVPFKNGAPYDSELIAELNQNLQASGFSRACGWTPRQLRRPTM